VLQYNFWGFLALDLLLLKHLVCSGNIGLLMHPHQNKLEAQFFFLMLAPFPAPSYVRKSVKMFSDLTLI
jgi:hypothetical protein